MTDEEIDRCIDDIRLKRELNNRLFCDWLAMSFKCPNCRVRASAYQQIIRRNDIGITKSNRPLAWLWRAIIGK